MKRVLKQIEHDLKNALNITWKHELIGASVSFGLGAGLGAIEKHTGEKLEWK